MGMKLIAITSVQQCEPWLERWQSLWTQCQTPNPFYHPAYLLPAWRQLGDEAVTLYFFLQDDTLVGLIPMQARSRFRGAPARWQRAWGFIHCFNDQPLFLDPYLDAGLTLLAQHWQQQHQGRLFSWLRLPRDHALTALLLQRYSPDILPSQRACLSPPAADFEPLEKRLSKKKRKEFARLWRRLAEQGELVYDSRHCSADDAGLDAFLALENAGWKARAGSALAANPDEHTFARDMFTGMAAAGQLYLYQLSLNGRVVASLTALSGGPHLYLFKISYDEALGQYSPGVLLMLEATREWEAQTRFTLVDSCAKQDHPMIDKLWHQRRQIVRAHCSSGGIYGNLLLTLSKLVTRWQLRQGPTS